MTRLVSAGLFALGLALLSGCGMGGPSVIEVEGTLTGPDGKPVPDVLIQFNPDKSTDRKVLGSSAVTDTSGRYVLKCDNGSAGAVVGPHRVVLIDNAGNSEDEPDPMNPKRTAKKQANRVPTVYLSPASTPLQVVVEAGKKTYDLKIDRR